MKVIYCTNKSGDAVDYYRAELPISTMARFGVCSPIKIPLDSLGFAIRSKNDQFMPYIKSAEVFVVNRLADYSFIELIREANPKAKIVADFDDNSFCVSPFSPHYETNGTKEVRYLFADGKNIDLWVSHDKAEKYKEAKVKPGFIDIERNKKTLEDIRRVAGEADLVTVTTEALGGVFSPYAKRIEVLPNCIDKRIWCPLDFRKTDEIRMGWFGGHSHYEDWSMIADAVNEIMRRNENVRLVIMGQLFTGTVKDIPKHRVEHHPWVGHEAYPFRAATLNLDFGIVPLHDTEFSRGKSPIKYVELSSLKIPSVVSMVTPYKELSTERNGVWVDGEDTASWVEGMQYMIDNPRERVLLAEEAHQMVLTDYEINGQFHRWAKAYKGVLKNGVPDSTHSVVVNS